MKQLGESDHIVEIMKTANILKGTMTVPYYEYKLRRNNIFNRYITAEKLNLDDITSEKDN